MLFRAVRAADKRKPIRQMRWVFNLRLLIRIWEESVIRSLRWRIRGVILPLFLCHSTSTTVFTSSYSFFSRLLKTRMHSSRMSSARSLPCRGVSVQRSLSGGPPGRNMGSGSQTGSDIIQRTPPPVNRITHKSKNITLLQTSIVGGTRKHSSGMHTACLPP